jgi:hypothetical protein
MIEDQDSNIEKVKALAPERQAYAAEILEHIVAASAAPHHVPDDHRAACLKDWSKPSAAKLRPTKRCQRFGRSAAYEAAVQPAVHRSLTLLPSICALRRPPGLCSLASRSGDGALREASKEREAGSGSKLGVNAPPPRGSPRPAGGAVPRSTSAPRPDRGGRPRNDQPW